MPTLKDRNKKPLENILTGLQSLNFGSMRCVYLLLEQRRFILQSPTSFVIDLKRILYSINEGLRIMLVYEIKDI